MSLAAGTRLGPYEILALIGAGGMGEVYRARDTRLDRTVAIKVLPADLNADPARRARFEREARAIASLTHPHICTLHDVGTHDSSVFLVMEYLEGRSLAQRLLRGPLPLGEALEVGAQVAEALAAAHDHGIVHRDLKPGNVMLIGAPGPGSVQAKLLDFGLAKSAGSEPHGAIDMSVPTATESLTRAGEVLGTRPYMAPEQVEGKPTDARTDIWALGCLLYEMVTGQRAFTGESTASLTAAILDREPQRTTVLQPVTPPALERLVSRCLAKRPDERSRSAHDVAHELRAMIREAERPRAAWRIGPTRRRTILAILALVATLAGGFAVVRRFDRTPRVGVPASPASLAVLPLTDRSPGTDQSAWCEGIAETLIDSLAAVPGLEVRGPQSSFKYSGTDDVREVGRRLKVDHVLAGTLQRAGDRLRISVRLIRAADDTHLWSQTFDGDVQRVFATQDEITAAVVGKLGARVSSPGAPTPQKRYTNDTRAYDLYLRANRVARNVMPEGQRQAIPLLQEAIARDPGFPLHHADWTPVAAELIAPYSAAACATIN